jgi:DNA sulfur modification protein DndD
MILRKLILENFGPYNGRQEIDLTVTKEAPVILIHGENERGKTTFANALRWCLYKRAFEADGSRIATYQLINWEALDLKDYHMTVTLEFEHASHVYVVERHVQSVLRPTSDSDLQWRETLRKDGHFQQAASVDRVVRDILHPQISNFFFFDGEMLNHYRVLLGDPNRNAILVRQSIEQILGLPAIQEAARNLETLRKAAENRQLQEARAKKANEKMVADAQQKQDLVDSIERDITHQREIQDKLEAERESLREKRDRFSELQVDLKRMDDLERDQVRIGEDTKLERDAIKALLREAWWIPLEPLIEKERTEAQNRATLAGAAAKEAEGLRHEISLMMNAVAKGTCSLCDHSLSALEVGGLKARLEDAQGKLAGIPANAVDLALPIERMTRLQPFAQRSARTLLERETRIRKLAIERKRRDTELTEIKERVKGDYRAEIAEVETDYDKCIAHLAAVNEELTDAAVKLRDASGALQRLQLQIRALPEANKKLAAEAALYGALKVIFENAIGTYRERLRQRVQEEATAIHQQLTTETGYAGLSINDQYGLTIINTEGREIKRPSAGSSQIVALSLIGALSKSATREGPVVMDTPFGRLDRGHRHNILKFAPHFAPQVILLVQSGELERERDLGDITPFVAREYRIIRDGASDRSLIKPIAS